MSLSFEFPTMQCNALQNTIKLLFTDDIYEGVIYIDFFQKIFLFVYFLHLYICIFYFIYYFFSKIFLLIQKVNIFVTSVSDSSYMTDKMAVLCQ